MLQQEAYGIKRKMWKEIKEEVVNKQVPSKIIKEKYNLDNIQVWHLFDNLLQGKYNHLYKRPPLEDISIGKYVYCENFGRGEITAIFSNSLMAVKFENRDFATMCDSEDMVTIHDDIRRKITEL